MTNFALYNQRLHLKVYIGSYQQNFDFSFSLNFKNEDTSFASCEDTEAQ